jgi:type III secretion protein N (ATPase)
VREFLEHELGEGGAAQVVIVCATSDKSSMERARPPTSPPRSPSTSATAGKRVLFLMDSVTRFARAQREIGLAAGEPPTAARLPASRSSHAARAAWSASA